MSTNELINNLLSYEKDGVSDVLIDKSLLETQFTEYKETELYKVLMKLKRISFTKKQIQCINLHLLKKKEINRSTEDSKKDDNDIDNLTNGMNKLKLENDGFLEKNLTKKDDKVGFCALENDKSNTINKLSAEYWKNTTSYKSVEYKETQYDYYKKNNSSEEVLRLVNLESKPFGSISEKIIREVLNLANRTSSQNDATLNNKKIEIKCARYWAGKNDCVWQHLEPEHDYEYALFALLDFNSWKVWCIKKDLLMGEMREKKIVTYQGKQGWWVRKSAIEEYLKVINNTDELIEFMKDEN
jgi:hypothetical protein